MPNPALIPRQDQLPKEGRHMATTHIHIDGVEGHDFARFTLVDHDHGGLPKRRGLHPLCSACKKEVRFTIRWRTGVGGIITFLESKIGHHQKWHTLILKNPGQEWLGIECGCYAKFHRQIAHIVDATKR